MTIRPSLKFRIEKIQTVTKTTLLYVDVVFLENDQVIHCNDFIMQIWPTYQTYIGRVGPNGKQLDKGPEYFEEHDTDVAGEILANIGRYAARSAMNEADNRDPGIVTEDSDPLGLRAKPGVADLIGVEMLL